MSTVVVEKQTKGFAFASATWHFSTEQLPEEARGDFFGVTRQLLPPRQRRATSGCCEPLEEGDPLAPGDQVEVQLSLRAKHAAEYVHLRDPRGAGFEPETHDLALQVGPRHLLVRGDPGLRHQLLLRVAAGRRVHLQVPPAGRHGRHLPRRPAILQSMYAPEFTAYSAGHRLEVEAD